MHMADALISPIVGGTMFAAAAGMVVYSSKKIQLDSDDQKIPLMGVMGAFIFAAQMINFTIPGTGSSGHIGGGLLLAILLGPEAGFLTLASVLIIQALIFGDGGLLALGCNIINLGFFTCFVAYPLVFKRFLKSFDNKKKMIIITIVSAVLGLQMGALGVVIETVLSGKTDLPFQAFVWVMLPIHLAIGVIEGIVTAAVINFVWKMKPEILLSTVEHSTQQKRFPNKILIIFIIATVFVGGGLSWFASENPDGLEWSIEKVAGELPIEEESSMAIFPDYGFKNSEGGTSFSGIVGGGMVLLLTVGIGFGIKRFKK